jgi:hypothetical protein
VKYIKTEKSTICLPYSRELKSRAKHHPKNWRERGESIKTSLLGRRKQQESVTGRSASNSDSWRPSMD